MKGEPYKPSQTDTIAALNTQYHLSMHGATVAGKKSAERAFYACHEWLRQSKTTFHLCSKAGKWVIGEVLHD